MGEEEQSRNICMLKNHFQVLMNIDYYQPLFVRIDIRIPFDFMARLSKILSYYLFDGLYIVDVLTTPFEFWQPNGILLCCFKDAKVIHFT